MDDATANRRLRPDPSATAQSVRLPKIALSLGRRIGPGEPCFVVAEIGQNHNGDLDAARQLIDRSAYYGADAVKFCKRHIPSDLTAEAYERPYVGPQSFGRTYGEHRERLELSIERYAELKARAESIGLVFFATACDRRSVDELESIDVPLYKVASRDLSNLPLIDQIAQTGKPVFLSCGMDSLDEIGEAVDAVRRRHDRLVLMHCTSAYPTPLADVNLRAMLTLRERFETLVGLSDHSLGPMIPVVAAALGAVVVEKHVTLDRHQRGTDHACSLEIAELEHLVQQIRDTELALGDGVVQAPPSVEAARQRLGRALVLQRPLAAGETLIEEMLCLKSGGVGISWRERIKIVGKAALRPLPADRLLCEEDFG